MAVLFASSYAGAFKLMAGTALAATSGWDTTYSDGAIDTAGAAAVYQIQTPDFAAELTEGWAHCYFTVGSTASYKVGNFFGFYNSVRDGWDLVAYVTNVSSTDYVEFQYWNGSAMISTGSAVAMAATGSYNWDIYFKKHTSTGILQLYKDGALLYSATGLNLSNISVNCARFKGMGSYLADGRISQMIVADESTIGAKVFSPNLSTGAVNTMLSGGASDLDVDSMRLPNTFVTMDTDGQIGIFACEDLSTSMDVMAVVVNTRAKKGATGPTQMEILARVGSTNYSSDTKALTAGVEAVSHVFNTNPATGLSWTASIVNVGCHCEGTS